MAGGRGSDRQGGGPHAEKVANSKGRPGKRDMAKMWEGSGWTDPRAASEAPKPGQRAAARI